MAARLKLVVAYDGAAFAGWQSQAHANTIQDHLERAFSEMFAQKLGVHGAGRTDAGVHAIGQTAHIDLPDRRFAAERLMHSSNSLLPAAIRVMRCSYVSERFHARFSATGKLYRYRIRVGEILPPFEVGRAWHVRERLDIVAARSATERFIGRHDFRAFAANRGRPQADCVRTIRIARFRATTSAIAVDFEGDGFLYKMVRLMVGAIVRCGRGEASPTDVERQLASGTPGATRLVAPAAGLFLLRVRY
jgi:tRNA pseudouridine38-40 synthase